MNLGKAWRRLWHWLWVPGLKKRQPKGYRLNIPGALVPVLRALTAPTMDRSERLALLSARYASEAADDVVVAIAVHEFPDEAYVTGTAAANFDTNWVMGIADSIADSNSGLLLVHRHGGAGKPSFSAVDASTNRDVMKALSIGMETMPFGALLLSADDYSAVCTVRGRLVPLDVNVVPMHRTREAA